MPLTDNQKFRARGPLIQTFYDLYVKLTRNLKVLSLKLQPQALIQRYYELNDDTGGNANPPIEILPMINIMKA